MITAWHRSTEVSKRLDDIPGVGPVLATALVASVADPKMFQSGRDFSAWIGLVLKLNSSGGNDRLARRSLSARPVHDWRAPRTIPDLIRSPVRNRDDSVEI
jgi:transposase